MIATATVQFTRGTPQAVGPTHLAIAFGVLTRPIESLPTNLYGVLCAPGEHLGDLRPLISALTLHVHDDLILLKGGGRFADKLVGEQGLLSLSRGGGGSGAAFVDLPTSGV